MKRLKINNLLLYIAGLMILVAAGCRNNDSRQEVTQEALSYISNYTRGPLRSESSVMIGFYKALPQHLEPGKTLDGVLEVSPPVSGKCLVSGAHGIEFIPEKAFEHGKTYRFHLHLNKLFAKAKSDFEFSVKIVPLHFQLVSSGIKPENDPQNPSYSYTGKLVFTDVIDFDKAKTMIQAEYLGEHLNISFLPGENDVELPFQISGILRQDQNELLHIHIDGSSLNIDNQQDIKIKIPGKNSFEIVNIRPVSGNTQYIEIQFSENLKQKQDLNGLIKIKDNKTEKFLIRDNVIKIFPAKHLDGEVSLQIYPGIESSRGTKITNSLTYEIQFPSAKPEVRWVKEGVILPDAKNLHLPFMAINLKAVDVTVIKVFGNNVLQFLQENGLSGSSQLKRVGRPLFKKRIRLGTDPGTDLHNWNVFSIDLSDVISREPGAFYRIKISFKKEYAALACNKAGIADNADLTGDIDWSEWRYSQDDYWWDDEDYPPGYEWEERDNPCHISYYTSRRWIEQNVLASNIGIIAKKGEDNVFHIAATDILTTQALEGVDIKIYDFQQQLIAGGTTGKRGFCKIPVNREAFALVASYHSQKAYLRLVDGDALSVSRFEVKGQQLKNGIQAYIYGERGVWRPGDTLHISLILKSSGKALPANYPVNVEFYNPLGQLENKFSQNRSENHLYVFSIATSPDAPTGAWHLKVKAAGTTFSKTIRIETVKPNRLKMHLRFDQDVLAAFGKKLTGNIDIAWLHGTPAKNIKYDILLSLKKGKTEFPQYPDYIFDNPIHNFSANEYEFASGKTDDEGKSKVVGEIEYYNDPPGMLQADFMIRAYEPGGNFSTNYMSEKLSPYDTYVGIRMPEGNSYGYLETGKKHRIDIATVDNNGNPLSVNNIKLDLYRINWRWWYDVYENRTSNFYANTYNQLVSSKTVRTSNGKGKAYINIPDDEWGRYFVRVRIPDGHSTGKVFFADWPASRSRANRKNPDGATMLTFASDKKSYLVGDKARISFPSAGEGRALVSIENGTKVLQEFWVEPDTSQTETRFEFDITKEMSPNVYVHISLLQPHQHTANDIPIRSYGILPVMVENPGSHLEPRITMKDQLSPGKKFTVKISEKNRRKMTYTLAIVDEGLLDLTNFKTPDPWKHFYRKEALGVKTWDYYDEILGAFGGKIEKLFAVGGDDDLPKKGIKKANRFKPVVLFAGPFTYDGKIQKHTFTMPYYVGAVRVMVVAENDNAFGKTEKSVPVKNPLMIAPTFPRIMSPGDEAYIPVSVFAMEKKVKKVKINIQANELFEISGTPEKEITFDKPDEKTIYFKLKAKQKTGTGKIKITAVSGKYHTHQSVEMDVRASNPVETHITEAVLNKGETKDFEIHRFGIQNTQKSYVEFSTMPPLDLGKRLHYLLQYPYGCSEQITSKAFAQLHLSSLMQLDGSQQKAAHDNVQKAIEILQGRQNLDGGIKYWASSTQSNEWLSSYAGQFLWEAKDLGYYVPQTMLTSLQNYLSGKARIWQPDTYSSYTKRFSIENQAYRLFVLAMMGKAETGAMNRLKEKKNVSNPAAWQLAAAYSLSGKESIARKMVDKTSIQTMAYDPAHNQSFGSSLRDKALILNTLNILKDKERMSKLLFQLAQEVSSKSWMSTQTTAMVLSSIGKVVESNGVQISKIAPITFSINGKTQKRLASNKMTIHRDFSFGEDGTARIEVENPENNLLYVRIFNEASPIAGKEKSNSNGILLNALFEDENHNIIQPDRIKSGTDFTLSVKIRAANALSIRQNVVLETLFPPGWEIINSRTGNFEFNEKQSAFDYQDIRDDRIYTFFDLSLQPKKYVFHLHAAYGGKYYLPAIHCEAMYDHSISASIAGKWIEVGLDENQLAK